MLPSSPYKYLIFLPFHGSLTHFLSFAAWPSLSYRKAGFGKTEPSTAYPNARYSSLPLTF